MTISSEKLSFNLVNEPIVLPTEAKLGALKKAGITEWKDIFSSEVVKPHAGDYVRVARAAIDGIRLHDPQRLVITDGLVAGNVPIPSLFDTYVMQSCHTYNPMPLTHHQCEWARGILTGSESVASWPLKDSTSPMPADDSLRRDQNQRLFPSRPIVRSNLIKQRLELVIGFCHSV